ncbi:phospholipase A1 [Xanthomonas oryzae pv. oryzicola BLS256]|uniref:Phospholipase A1 n=1 Tax=Xanthomonas oryzae pv. oryzicola (strain BLS256) TaxID=383407 RepID=G7TJW6_XANOB|nr:phospholipase A1 [Xanthomonas oryzae pv. oryzicola BLS256]
MLCHARNIHAKKSHRKRFLQLLASAPLRRDLPQRRQECDQQKEISMQPRFPALRVLATSFFAVSCTASPAAKEQTTMSATLQDHTVAFRDPALTNIAKAIAHDNEILTHLQEDSIPLKWSTPDAAGHQIE